MKDTRGKEGWSIKKKEIQREKLPVKTIGW